MKQSSIRKIVPGLYDITVFARLPSTLETIKGEEFSITREDDDKIRVRTNYPIKWNVNMKHEPTENGSIYTLPSPRPSPLFLTLISEDPAIRLQQHIVQLYNQEAYADLKAVDENDPTRVIHLHTFVLDSHTDFFKALKDFKGKSCNVFEVESKMWDATAAVLYFCYTGLLPENDDWEAFMDVYITAEMLMVNSMLQPLVNVLVPAALSKNALKDLVEKYGTRWLIYKKIIEIQSSERNDECERCHRRAVVCRIHSSYC